MKFGSVCSGIEAASVAWYPLGWKAEWLSEIDPFPSAVLAHHYPDVPNLGDMTKIVDKLKAGEINAPDVFVGGTPCQAFSVAGLRGGLADPRGGLTLEFVRIANAIDDIRLSAGERPAIIVWENVPGVLSSKDNAFGCFLGALAGEDCELVPPRGKWTYAGCVYDPARSIAWRVLDAQYFGLAQRRRRVFVVASAGDIDPSEILFEFDGVRRDTPPSREAWKGFAGAAGTIAASGGWMSRTAGGCNETDFCIPVATSTGDIAHCLNAGGMGRLDYESETMAVTAFHPTQDPIHSSDGTTHALGCGSSYGQSSIAVAYQTQARRLTPTECERLQGFPDGYTAIPWRKKSAEECPDGPRYKALGNSMATNVMAWIGNRIKKHMEAM